MLLGRGLGPYWRGLGPYLLHNLQLGLGAGDGLEGGEEDGAFEDGEDGENDEGDEVCTLMLVRLLHCKTATAGGAAASSSATAACSRGTGWLLRCLYWRSYCCCYW
jgi:hypothetical protein